MVKGDSRRLALYAVAKIVGVSVAVAQSSWGPRPAWRRFCCARATRMRPRVLQTHRGNRSVTPKAARPDPMWEPAYLTEYHPDARRLTGSEGGLRPPRRQAREAPGDSLGAARSRFAHVSLCHRQRTSSCAAEGPLRRPPVLEAYPDVVFRLFDTRREFFTGTTKFIAASSSPGASY